MPKLRAVENPPIDEMKLITKMWKLLSQMGHDQRDRILTYLNSRSDEMARPSLELTEDQAG